MSFEKLLNSLCDIQEKSETQDALGSVDSPSWTNIATNVKTRKSPVTQKPQVGDEDYHVTLEDFVFFFLASVTVGKANRIVFDSQNYQILGVRKDSKDHHKEVFARLITQD